MMGLALGCEIAPRSIFHRKNYFYPDQAKNYQISQYDIPICRGGRLGDVRLHRIHLEEDAAKLVHLGESGRIHGADASIVDYNRGGTPLCEIVTEPDIHSAEQARDWLNLLRVTLRQLGVSDVNMEEGSLRCDANVSVRPAGSERAGHEDRAQEHELLPLPRARRQRGDRAPDRAARGGRAGRAGDAALRPASGRLSVAALQGGGARLPLLPRARPRAARADRGDARGRARRAARAAGRARRALRARLGAVAGRRAPARLRAAVGRLLRARRRRARRRRARGRELGRSSCARGSAPRPSPAASTSRRTRSPQLVGLVGAQAASTRARARQVLDGLVAEGGDPAAIVEREGLGGDGAAATSWPASSRPRSPPTRARRRRCAAATTRRWARSSAS